MYNPLCKRKEKESRPYEKDRTKPQPLHNDSYDVDTLLRNFIYLRDVKHFLRVPITKGDSFF